MMSLLRFIIPLFFFLNVNTQAQNFDCKIYYEQFCDSLDYIPYAVKSIQHTKDSNDIDIPDCIYDLDSFCEGIQKAMNEKRLSIRSAGDPSHVNPCTYYAYEKWGVKLIMTGDIIMDHGIFDENAGYNLIMDQRIKKALGKDYKKLGIVDEEWVDLKDEEFWNELIENAVIAHSNTDSTACIQIDMEQIKQTKFGHLDNVIFKDRLSKKIFSLEEFINGVDVKIRSRKSKIAIIEFDFSNYQHPLFCKNDYFVKYTVPFKIVD